MSVLYDDDYLHVRQGKNNVAPSSLFDPFELSLSECEWISDVRYKVRWIRRQSIRDLILLKIHGA